MRKLVLQLPDELYGHLAKAAEDQDLTVEEFAEETLSQVLELDEDGDDDEDLDLDADDEDEEDWDDDDEPVDDDDL